MIRAALLSLLIAGAGPAFGQISRSTGVPEVGRPSVLLPDESAGLDKLVPALLSAFDHADILALGETHWRKWDSDIRIQLVRHRDFAKKVQFVVVEFASTAFQETLDRYIRGDSVPLAELQQVWRNTTQTNGVWESPVYAEFFAAVREVNLKLPSGRRIQVLAGDPPRGGGDRTDSVVSILKERVLAQGGKALAIYGSSHFDRAGKGVGGISKALQVSHPGRIFVVKTMGGTAAEYRKFESALTSAVRPVLVSLGRMPFHDFSADEFLGGDNKMLVNGAWVNAPVFKELTLGEVADACIYLGMSADVTTRVEPTR